MNMVGACLCKTGDYIILGPKMIYGKYTLETCAINEIIFDECKIKNWEVKKISFFYSLTEITNKPFEEIT